jgi:hypothetical protein
MQSWTLLLEPELQVPLSQSLWTNRKPFDDVRHPERHELIGFQGPQPLLLITDWDTEKRSSDITNLAGSAGGYVKIGDGVYTGVGAKSFKFCEKPIRAG